MAGKSLLWITNAGIHNYGALYCKSNSFGYKDDGTDADHFDDIPLSTLCFDKNDKVVRQIKVLGDLIPSSGITSIARNKATHEYNVFQNYNDRDSRFSALFITFNARDEEGPNYPIGIVVRLNTTVEQADTIDNIMDAYSNEVTIIGNSESGLAGFANTTGTSGSGFIIGNTGGTDADEEHPTNDHAIVQVNGAQTLSNNGSITVETLGTGGVEDEAFDSGSPEAPNNVLPNGPGVVSYFDDNGFFRKVWYNGSSATSISNLYTQSEAYATIADHKPLILRGENFQKDWIIGAFSGPYEGNPFPTNGAVTRYGNLFPPATPSHITPSNVDIEDTKLPTIAYVWPKGSPALNDGTDASDEGRRSQYRASDYYVTTFNKGGKNNMHLGSFRKITASNTVLDEFNDTNFFNIHINRLYQYTKYTVLEFTDGDAHVEADDGAYPNFPAGVTRYYKLSYEYDGFQDSPLSTSTFPYKNTTSDDYKNVKIKVRIPFNLSQRVSSVVLWRRGLLENDTQGEAYKKVAKLNLLSGGGWIKVEETSGEFYEQEITDNLSGDGESYKQLTEMPESIQNSNLNYSISISAGGKLYVAGFKHSLLPEGNNSLAWSKPGKYSQFNILEDREDLDDDITALAFYNNILFIFSLNKLYKMDVSSNTIIDEVDGFGCLNKDSVIVTEYGMFFADKNHIYKYEGNSVEIISYPIDIDDSVLATSWEELTSTSDIAIRLYFSSRLNVLIAMGTVAGSTTKCFTYHVLKRRWDYRFFSIKNASNGFDSQSIVNNLLIPSKLGGNLYALTSAEGKGDQATDQSCKLIEVNKNDEEYGQIYWVSKDFTMGNDTNDKRFKKLKIEASTALTTSPTVAIDGSSSTLTSSGTNEWKITSNKKGRKIKVTLPAGNDNIQIYSIGIVYRPMKIR